MSWDAAKLDLLMGDTQRTFLEALRYDEEHPEEPSTHEQIGYFMYRLHDCNPDFPRLAINRTIEGPLFTR